MTLEDVNRLTKNGTLMEVTHSIFGKVFKIKKIYTEPSAKDDYIILLQDNHRKYPVIDVDVLSPCYPMIDLIEDDEKVSPIDSWDIDGVEL